MGKKDDISMERTRIQISNIAIFIDHDIDIKEASNQNAPYSCKKSRHSVWVQTDICLQYTVIAL